MAGEWPVLSLREAGISLIDCDHRTPPAASDGYPYVTIPQIKDGRLDLSAVRRISAQHYKEWTRKARPSQNDIVLSRRCNPGETAFVPNGIEFALGQNLVVLRADGKKVFPQFLRWLVRSPEWREQVQRFINVGAVFDSLKCADIPNFELSIPPLNEQRLIAEILSALDDKTELNRRMNETLEAMARALFKSWFVDFDPVRAKAEGRDPGLPASVADLFPDCLVDSELGEIPHSWIGGTLAKVSRMNPEAWSSATRPKWIRYIDLSNVKWGRIETIVCHERDMAPSRAQRILRTGDTIVGSVRPGNGSYALIPEDGLTGSTGFCVLRPRRREYAEYVFLSATARENISALAHLADGAAYPAIRPEVVAATPAVLPPEQLMRLFSGAVRPLLERMAMNGRQESALAALRDGLLPKLISGELRIEASSSGRAGKTG